MHFSMSSPGEPYAFAPYVAGESIPGGETQWLYDAVQGTAVVALNQTGAEATGLLSATIYARQFEDDVLPYDC